MRMPALPPSGELKQTCLVFLRRCSFCLLSCRRQVLLGELGPFPDGEAPSPSLTDGADTSPPPLRQQSVVHDFPAAPQTEPTFDRPPDEVLEAWDILQKALGAHPLDPSQPQVFSRHPQAGLLADGEPCAPSPSPRPDQADTGCGEGPPLSPPSVEGGGGSSPASPAEGLRDSHGEGRPVSDAEAEVEEWGEAGGRGDGAGHAPEGKAEPSGALFMIEAGHGGEGSPPVRRRADDAAEPSDATSSAGGPQTADTGDEEHREQQQATALASGSMPEQERHNESSCLCDGEERSGTEAAPLLLANGGASSPDGETLLPHAILEEGAAVSSTDCAGGEEGGRQNGGFFGSEEKEDSLLPQEPRC